MSSSDAQLLAAAQADPWVTLTPAAGLTTIAGFYAPAARQWFDMVQLRGELGTSIANGSTLTTLPAGLRPASSVRFPVAASGPVTGSVTINPAGLVVFFASATATAVSLGNVWFSLV